MNVEFTKAVQFNDQGLVPVIAQDSESGDVLMFAWMNRDTLLKTVETGIMTYWSRSRKSVWVKGDTSGNRQKVVSVSVDCDGDVLLFKVIPEGVGAACHEGYRTCFWRKLENGEWKVEGEPLFNPKEVYGK